MINEETTNEEILKRNETGWITGKEIPYVMNKLTDKQIQKQYDRASGTSNQMEQDRIIMNIFNDKVMANRITVNMYRKQLEHEESTEFHEDAIGSVVKQKSTKDARLNFGEEIEYSKYKTTKIEPVLVLDPAFDSIERTEYSIVLRDVAYSLRYKSQHLQVFAFFLVKSDTVRRLDKETRSLLMPIIQKIWANVEDTHFGRQYSQRDFITIFNMHPNGYYKIKKEVADMLKRSL